ncbi:MAG: hypothetical protein V7629_16780, partial [Motiliproteus sp.]
MASLETYSWRRLLPSVVIASALAVSGCSDDGSDGAAGPAGPSGPNIIVKSEIPATMVALIDSATVAGDGALSVNFSLEDELGNGFVGMDASQIRFTVTQLVPAGADGDGEPSKWQSYINKVEKAPTDLAKGPGVVDQDQATSETATKSGSFVDNGDGSYSYTL